MSAMFFGSIIYGTLSDRIGRKKTAFMAQLNVSIGLLLTAFMPNYISFAISRFITGVGKFFSLMANLFWFSGISIRTKSIFNVFLFTF